MSRETYAVLMTGKLPHSLHESTEAAKAYAEEMDHCSIDPDPGETSVSITWPVHVIEDDR